MGRTMWSKYIMRGIIAYACMSEQVYANINCLCWSKNYHVRKSAKRVDTFDIAFSDNRISVTSNDVYIDSLGVTHYGEGET